MHVVFLLQDTGEVYGAERATLDLVSRLHTNGEVQVTVLLIRESRMNLSHSKLEESFRQIGVNCQWISVKQAFSLTLIKRLRHQLATLECDCLHVVGYKAAVHGGLAVGFGRRQPWVSTVHGWLNRPDLKERLYGWLEIQTLKRANCVVVPSRYYRDKLIAKGVKDRRLKWIPSGLDLDQMTDAERPTRSAAANNQFTVGILGRLSKEKNQPMFLAVARHLLEMGVRARFLIAGDGPERQRLQCEIGRLELDDAVEMPGFMDRHEFLRQIDVLATCSSIENLPCSILEAMAYGLPVVATRVGGIPDLIQDGDNGILVDSQDVCGMAKAIGKLGADASLRRRLGARGRRKMVEGFSLNKSVDRYQQMYRDVVNARQWR